MCIFDDFLFLNSRRGSQQHYQFFFNLLLYFTYYFTDKCCLVIRHGANNKYIKGVLCKESMIQSSCCSLQKHLEVSRLLLCFSVLPCSSVVCLHSKKKHSLVHSLEGSRVSSGCLPRSSSPSPPQNSPNRSKSYPPPRVNKTPNCSGLCHLLHIHSPE
jgi:hypothetical protein